MLDLTLLAQEIAAIVGEQVAAAVAPLAAEKAALLARVEALEASQLDDGRLREMVEGAVVALPAPADGKSITVDDITPLIAAEVERAVAALPVPQDGKSVTLDDMRPLIDAAVASVPAPADGKSVSVDDVAPLIAVEVERAVAALPLPQDGTSVTIDDVRPLIESAVAAMPMPADGKSVTVDDVAPLITAEIERAVAALPAPRDGASVSIDDVRPLIADAVATLPAPKDGQSVTVADVEPLIAREVERAVAALPGPIGLAGAMIDRKGALMVTLSDGKLIDLGRVEGKNGDPGLGFDDLALEQISERSFVVRFNRGEQVKTFTFSMPVMLDRGVFRAGEAYEKGDCVTYAGSLWIAQADTSAKPDGAESGWRLGVKRGRDARGAEAR